MAEINPLKFGVTGNQYLPNDSGDSRKAKADEQYKAPAEGYKKVSSEDVLGYMAGLAPDMVPTQVTRTFNVSKYVSSEDELSITTSMENFDAEYNKALLAAKTEFPGLSDEAAEEIALAYVNSII